MSANTETMFEAGYDIVPDLIQSDINADVTGDRVNLQNWERAYYVLSKPAGVAGDDPVLNFKQHTAASGGTSAALTISKLWAKVGVMSALGTWTTYVLSTAVSALDLQTVGGTDLVADTQAAVVIVEVRADSLNVASGYKFVSVDYTGTDIGNALLVNAMWHLYGNRYPQALPLTSLA